MQLLHSSLLCLCKSLQRPASITRWKMLTKATFHSLSSSHYFLSPFSFGKQAALWLSSHILPQVHFPAVPNKDGAQTHPLSMTNWCPTEAARTPVLPELLHADSRYSQAMAATFHRDYSKLHDELDEKHSSIQSTSSAFRKYKYKASATLKFTVVGKKEYMPWGLLQTAASKT